MRPYARLCSIEVLGGPQRVSAVALRVTTTTTHGADIRCMTELANRRESWTPLKHNAATSGFPTRRNPVIV